MEEEINYPDQEVFIDEDGKRYILVEPSIMDEGEEESYKPKRVYLD